MQETPKHLTLLALGDVFCRIVAWILAWVCFVSNDVVWFWATATCLILCTIIDMAICFFFLNAHGWRKLFWVLLSVLQLKSFGDMVSHLHDWIGGGDGNNLPPTKQMDNRVTRFLANIFLTLPISFILTYVLMLDLHGRFNEQLLTIGLLCALLSCSLSVTSFIAGADDTPHIGAMVFLHIMSQLLFRLMAVCLLCVRFAEWGLLVLGISWFAVYLFGPQGTFPVLLDLICCRSMFYSNPATPILKLFITPLSFFVLLKVLYERPTKDRVVAVTEHQPPLVRDSFCETKFIFFRLFENVLFCGAFIMVPNSWLSSKHDFEEWMHHPTLIFVLGVFTLLTAVVTWMWVVKENTTSYAQQRDEEFSLPRVQPSSKSAPQIELGGSTN